MDQAAATTDSREKIIAEVENRLQLNIFVSIFFCSLAYAVVKTLKKPGVDTCDVDANKALLNWAVVPMAYLLSYFVFEVSRCVIPRWWLKCISVMLLAGTFLFVTPMALIAASEAKWHPIDLWIGFLSIRGMPVIPMVLVIPIVLGTGAGLINCVRKRKG